MSDYDQPDVTVNDLPQPTLDDVSFDRRVLVMVLLDISGSMSSHAPELYRALARLIQELKNDSIAIKSAELAVVGFGNERAETLREFATVRDLLDAPQVHCDGGTPFGLGLRRALQMLSDRQTELMSRGVPQYKPLVFILSDGCPTDHYAPEALKFAKAAEQHGYNVFALGYGDAADTKVLGSLTPHVFKATSSFSFADWFKWISRSVARVSRSSESDEIEIEVPPGVIKIKV